MAPKAEKKLTKEKKFAMAKKALVEKKSKADKKFPKDGGAAAGEKKKKRTKKSIETYKFYIFKVLKQAYPNIRISNKTMGIMNSFTHLLHDGYKPVVGNYLVRRFRNCRARLYNRNRRGKFTR